MKKLLLILVSAFVAFGASAQGAKPKMAVYTSKVAEVPTLGPLTSQIVKSFLADYEVVGRAGEFQQLIDKEFDYQSSGKVDDKQLAERGRQFGVDYICAVVVHKFSESYYFEARIISVENANVVGIADADTGNELSPSELMRIGKDLVVDLNEEVSAYDAQQAKPSIAVYTSKVAGVPTLGPMTSQIVKSFLADYEVVGRAGEFQQLIDKEFDYQSSGKVDDKQLAERGRQFGVDYICAVVVHKFSESYYFEARIISVENANVVGIADADTGNELSPSELMRIGKDLVVDLNEEVSAYDAQQAKPSIAVYTNTLNGVPTFSPMTSQIIRALLGEYEVVARSGDFQKLIDDEYIHQANGYVDDAQLSKSGKQYGVDYICAVVVNGFETSKGAEYYFEARIISVENANLTSLADANWACELSPGVQRRIGMQLGGGLKGEDVLTTGTHRYHNWVDLGLPSGLKWATCNVGTSRSYNFGSYYAWGETEVKSKYNERNAISYNKSWSDIGGNSSRDAATANWGGNWRLPTEDEFRELRKHCTWDWTTLNGYNGYKVTGPNGQSIFLPAAGYRHGADEVSVGSYGSYWSSTPDESDACRACCLSFILGYPNMNWHSRDHGHSVRPVLD